MLYWGCDNVKSWKSFFLSVRSPSASSPVTQLCHNILTNIGSKQHTQAKKLLFQNIYIIMEGVCVCMCVCMYVCMYVCVLLIFSVGSRRGRKLIFCMLGALTL